MPSPPSARSRAGLTFALVVLAALVISGLSALHALRTELQLGDPGQGLREEIDEVNEVVYPDINDGVYRCGFAGTQAAYDRRVTRLFEALDLLESRLAGRRYLVGEMITEADWRLFPTLLRFDPVYFGHFKCNFRRIGDYPCLSNYLRELYQIPGIAELCNFRHIKEHYYRSHKSINPTCIVPGGPEMTLNQPHDRTRL